MVSMVIIGQYKETLTDSRKLAANHQDLRSMCYLLIHLVYHADSRNHVLILHMEDGSPQPTVHRGLLTGGPNS